jgi:hypothetical protein
LKWKDMFLHVRFHVNLVESKRLVDLRFDVHIITFPYLLRMRFRRFPGGAHKLTDDLGSTVYYNFLNGNRRCYRIFLNIGVVAIRPCAIELFPTRNFLQTERSCQVHEMIHTPPQQSQAHLSGLLVFLVQKVSFLFDFF